MKSQRLCLCMMVKNEEQVLARALHSVRDIIDYWVICDTGSTDNTPAIVLDSLTGIPGELHRVEWVNFGHNRSQALQLARHKADYILLMDADMVVRVKGDFKDKLALDYYEIRYEGPLDYTQPMLLSDRHDWAFVGVTHEFVYAETAQSWDFLPELHLLHFGDGGMRSDKYERDIHLLRAELEKEPDNLRNLFYLAQSYRDNGQPEAALHWYRERVNKGVGWQEEQWYARYQVASMLQQTGAEWPQVLESYLEAHAARPGRLEPVYQVIKYYREMENYAMGYYFSNTFGQRLAYPSADRLFIEKPMYDYLWMLEHGVCAYGTDRVQEAWEAFEKVLQCPDLPDWVHESATRGRDMAHTLLHPGVTDMEPIESNTL